MKGQYEAIRSGAVQRGTRDVIGKKSGRRRSTTRRSDRNIYVYSGSYGRNQSYDYMALGDRRSNPLPAFLLRPLQKKLSEAAAFLSIPAVRQPLVRTAVLAVAAAVLCNFVCAVKGGGIDNDIAVLTKQQMELESTNIHLLAKRAVVWGPDNMAKLAEELQLYPAEEGQEYVYDWRYGKFR